VSVLSPEGLSTIWVVARTCFFCGAHIADDRPAVVGEGVERWFLLHGACATELGQQLLADAEIWRQTSGGISSFWTSGSARAV
jgi:hypothetical protein